MKKPKLNVRLLRKIQKHITEEPRRFQMNRSVLFVKTQKMWDQIKEWGLLANTNDMSKLMPPCGTAACIAGWANILTGAEPDSFEATSRERAAERLGVDAGGQWVGHSLFYANSWPSPYVDRFAKAKTPKARAKIACQRIDHLIETGE